MATSWQIFVLYFLICIFSGCAQNLFVNIDCGARTNFTDSHGIKWVGDAPYINTGLTAKVKAKHSGLPRQLTTLRYFTSGKKSCYVVPNVTVGGKYLVRASFYYGNYDKKSSPPTFSLQFDGKHWDNVKTSLKKEVVYEVTYQVEANIISICVAQTSPGQIPFISSLEIRPLLASMYPTASEKDVLFTLVRTAFGSPAVRRYPDDPFDRIWHPNKPIKGLVSVTSDSNVTDVNYWNYPPETVMLHAVTPSSRTATNMTIPIPVQSATTVTVYRALYYSEVSAHVAAANSRNFDFEIDGRVFMPNITPPYKTYFMHYNTNNSLNSSSILSWVNWPNARVPPLINAWEFFIVRSGLAAGTNVTDVRGLKTLQGTYRKLLSWSGDPCLPIGFNWEWVGCNANDPPRVTELHLNGYELKGTLPDFSDLDALRIIDFHNNSLTGSIPEFFIKFSNLTVLNLADNNFSGTIPCSLAHSPHIKLNSSGNPNLKRCPK